MRWSRKTIVAAVAAGALALGGAGTAAGFGFLGGGGPRGSSAQDLADAINKRAGTSITAAQVQGAFEDLFKERLDEAVQRGDLTRAQADRLLERYRELPRLEAQARNRAEKAVAPVAQLLGVTAEQLWERVRDGQSLAEQAQAKGISRERLIDAIVQGLKAGGAQGTDAQLERVAGRIADGEPGRFLGPRSLHRHGPAPPLPLPFGP
jgi:hypothetical protein